MTPVSHFLIAWLAADSVKLDRKERTLVTLAGVLPDLDGLGALPELISRNWEHPLMWYTNYHHALTHNIGFALLLVIACYFLAKKQSRGKTAIMAFVAFNLHILADVAGSRGPDGFQWPIPYFRPFTDNWQLVWNGQWELGAWPNFLIGFIVLYITFYWAWKKGHSPVGIFSTKADKLFIATLRHRFPIDKRAKICNKKQSI